MRRILLLLIIAACLAVPAVADYTPGGYSGWYSFGGVNTTGGYLAGSVGGDSLPDTSSPPDGMRDYTPSVYWSTYTLNQWAGTLQSGPTGSNPRDTFVVACIDLVQNASSQKRWYTDVDLTAAPIGSGNQMMTQVQANRLKEFWTDHFADTTTPVARAAFQLGMWEIVYQRDVTDVKTYDVMSGWTREITPGVPGNGFETKRTTSAGSLYPLSGNNLEAANLANTWLRTTLEDGQTSLGGNRVYDVRALVNDDYQDWAFYVPELGVIPVPGAALLGLLGFSLIGWIKRRFG